MGTTVLRHPCVFLDVIEEHFEELDFLWGQRENVVFAPDWNLQELAALEERAEAHLDGLRLAEAHAVDIARPALCGDDKGAATAAAMILMAFGIPDLEAEVVMALTVAESGARDGLRIGLRHSDISRVIPRLLQVAGEGEAPVRAAALDVLGFHRQSPPRNLPELALQAGPEIRVLVNAALGRFGGPWGIDDLRRSLEIQDPGIQRSALETSARIGLPNLAGMCRQMVSRSENPSEAALAFLGVLGDPQDLPLLHQSLAKPALARGALAGMGALGQIAAIPLLIEAMHREELSLAAGAAFVRITGATGIEKEHAAPVSGDLPEDEIDPEEHAVPPDPERAQAWWERAKGRFTESGRRQCGEEISRNPLGPAFQSLSLETRRDVYLSQRVRDPRRTPDLELERRARLQTAVA